MVIMCARARVGNFNPNVNGFYRGDNVMSNGLHLESFLRFKKKEYQTIIQVYLNKTIMVLHIDYKGGFHTSPDPAVTLVTKVLH